MNDTTQARLRWFHLTPGRFVIGLLAVEVLPWLSDRFGWLGWHKGYAVLTGVAAVGAAMLLMLEWFGVALIFRWRFQFSLRSLLAMVIVVALPCSWMAVEMKKAKDQEAAVAAIEKTQGNVIYDDVTWGSAKVKSGFGWGQNAKPSGPDWLCNLVGHNFVSDVAVAHMGPTTTDSDLECFRALPEITALWLSGTQVTNKALEHVMGLTRLKMLDLAHTQVTDAGVEHLKDLTELRRLDVTGTEVTDESVKKLQQALPSCTIYH